MSAVIVEDGAENEVTSLFATAMVVGNPVTNVVEESVISYVWV